MTTRKIIIFGGSGQIGTILARHFQALGDHVISVSRKPKPSPWQTDSWDTTNVGPWIQHLEAADAVINLSGRSVNCRYNPQNRREILESRTLSTHLLGHAIAQCNTSPKLWMNASTSTIYRHALDRPMDELTGEIILHDPTVPETWNFSVGIALAWETAFDQAITPNTRKIALRSSMVMSPDKDGVFDVLSTLVHRGLGGTQGKGTQYVSWIHDQDYACAIDFLIHNECINGPVNLTAPNPIPNRDFMRTLRHAMGKSFGLPATEAMLEVGAVFLRTETELILKSRRVTPAILPETGFQFQSPTWPEAAKDLVSRSRFA